MDPTEDSVTQHPLDLGSPSAALDPVEDGARVERRRQPRRAADRALLRLGAVVESLEYLADGVVLLDARLRVVHVTQAGRRLIETCRDRIAIRSQRLMLACPDTARHLREFAETEARRDGDCAGGGSDPVTAS
jgi:hypothetical protein